MADGVSDCRIVRIWRSWYLTRFAEFGDMIFHGKFLVDDKTKVFTDVSSVTNGSRLDNRSVSIFYLGKTVLRSESYECCLRALRESLFEDIH